MKNRILLILTFFSAITYLQAAEKPLKIGYVKLDYVMESMPEIKQMEVDLKAFEIQIRNQLQQKAGVLQEKFQAFQKGHATMTDVVKSQKEAELQQLHGEFENFQMESQSSLVNKQAELYKPIYEKLQKTIELVAKENKYTHILNADTSVGIHIVLYGDQEYDISNLVLKKLGIDPIKAAVNKTAQIADKKLQEAKKQTANKNSQEKAGKVQNKK
jgi:outer membrane protein